MVLYALETKDVPTSWQYFYGIYGLLGSGHIESGLPQRAAICARGGKAFELYYIRLHHSRHKRRRADVCRVSPPSV